MAQQTLNNANQKICTSENGGQLVRLPLVHVISIANTWHHHADTTMCACALFVVAYASRWLFNFVHVWLFEREFCSVTYETRATFVWWLPLMRMLKGCARCAIQKAQYANVYKYTFITKSEHLATSFFGQPTFPLPVNETSMEMTKLFKLSFF